MPRQALLLCLASVAFPLTSVVAQEPAEGRICGWMALNPTTGKLYVANLGTANVSVIDTASNEVTAAIPIGQRPDQIAVDPATNRIYVANALDGTLSVIDGEKNEVIATIQVGRGPLRRGR